MATMFEDEVDRNFEVFESRLHGLLADHRDQFALMRHGEIRAFFSSEAEALAGGRATFGDGVYSIQQVSDRPVDLGFFSHAINPRIA